MPTDLSLSALFDDLADVRSKLRAETEPLTFHGLLHRGLETWRTALADLDAGGTAADALAAVTDAFAMEAELGRATSLATEMTALGVGTPVHRFLTAIQPVRREVERANQTVVVLLRKAVLMERRGGSRWRGSTGRASAMVDRDLCLEEVRVVARSFVARITALADDFAAWRSAY